MGGWGREWVDGVERLNLLAVPAGSSIGWRTAVCRLRMIRTKRSAALRETRAVSRWCLDSDDSDLDARTATSALLDHGRWDAAWRAARDYVNPRLHAALACARLPPFGRRRIGRLHAHQNAWFWPDAELWQQ